MDIINFVFKALFGTCIMLYNDDNFFFLTSNFIKSNIILTISLIYFLNLQNNLKKQQFASFYIFLYYNYTCSRFFASYYVFLSN